MPHSVIEPKPDSRQYPARPILGVGGLIFRDGAALLVKRGKEPGKGQWSIPGGAVRVGEKVAEAVVREIREEVGLTVTVGPLVEVVEKVFPDDEGRPLYHYVILDYLCFSDGGPVRPGSDAEEARFVPPGEWPDYRLAADAARVLRKALDMARTAGPL